MLTVGSFFSGCGMLDLGLHQAGLRHAWFCEAVPFRRELLAQRWPGAVIYPDIRAFRGADAVRVDVVAGGFPCKGVSTAGRQEGFGHPETVLWHEMARAISDLEPSYVLVENVANILALHDGAVWGTVLGDLATLGFDVVWDCVPAAAFGAPHLRDRVIAIASHADRELRQARVADARAQRPGRDAPGRSVGAATDTTRERRTAPEPEVQQPRMATVSRAGGATAPADADSDGVRQQPEPQRGRRGTAEPSEPREAVADPDSPRADAHAAAGRPRGAARERAVGVEWGEYEPAIARWEQIHGPAPEPLVRRVDDGNTLRLERSRLSALGDGVHVYLGRLAGEHILNLERERLSRAA